VVELGLPDLTTEQIETVCQTAENAARKAVLSKVSSKLIEKLDISVEAEGLKPLNITVEIDLVLASEAKGVDAKAVVDQAINEAHKASESYLRTMK
jgi:post-segregation antitoxin (ccd killing protein)